MDYETQYQQRGFASQRRYPNESLISFIASSFGHIPLEKRGAIKILELGCGSGANLWYLVKEGFNACGIDNAPAGIEYCRQMIESFGLPPRYPENLRVADMLDLPFKYEVFDAVVDVVSIEALPYSLHAKCYAEAFRVLKRGGKFFSFHLGENSISYLHGGGNRIDQASVDNVPDATKPLHNNGALCFLSGNEQRELLAYAKFKSIVIDKLVRTYNQQEFQIEYLVVRAEK